MIRSTFLGFETAKSAITTSQMGLNTVGHNISNVSTAGYSRQRVDQVSLSRSGYTSLYRSSGIANVGLGVMATGVNRIRNEYLDTRYRQEASSYSAIATRVNCLTDIEDILGELASDGLSSYVDKFVTALRSYSDDTSNMDLASTVRSEAQTLVQMTNYYANQLKNQQQEQITDLSTILNTEANAIIEKIAYLNQQIRTEHIVGNPANELMDSRDLLIDQLSEYADIKVVNTPETLSSGAVVSRMSILLVDSSVTPAEEYTLVDNGYYNTFRSTADENNMVTISLVDSAGGLVNDDITSNFTGGIIKGYLDMINGLGEFAGSGDNAFRGIQYYLNTLDVFAAKFAEQMNKLNSISKAEADATQYLLEYPDKNLFASSDGEAITASNITLSDAWLANVDYLTATKTDQELPEGEQYQRDENGNVFYYDDNGNAVYVKDQNNDNILKFIEMFSNPQYFSITKADGTKSNLFTGTLSEFLGDMHLKLGSDASLQTTMLSASYTVLESYTTQRESVSGVSVDEEAISMMVYQNYYNAACRYMTTIDEALNTIINGMGLVGR